MTTFNGKQINKGDNYCMAAGYRFFYEDANEFLGFLIGVIGPEAVLQLIGMTEWHH